MLDSLADYLTRFDIFSGLDFASLYSWLPSDIVSTLTSILAILFVLAVIGVVRKFIPLN